MKEASTRIFVVQGETDEDSSNYQTRSCVARSMNQHLQIRANKRKTRMDEREAKTRQRSSIERYLLYRLYRSGGQRLQINFQKRKETAARLKASNKVPNTRYACMVECHQSGRQRVEPSLPQFREDHIAGKGVNSMSHYNLVHKFIPMPQVAKIPDATAAVEK